MDGKTNGMDKLIKRTEGWVIWWKEAGHKVDQAILPLSIVFLWINRRGRQAWPVAYENKTSSPYWERRREGERLQEAILHGSLHAVIKWLNTSPDTWGRADALESSTGLLTDKVVKVGEKEYLVKLALYKDLTKH